jgi:pyrimidine operon attenuation protein/uracil phosphoribosyltransferase
MKVILDSRKMQMVINRMVGEIIEKNEELDKLALVGIRTGGVFLAERIRKILEKNEGIKPDIGILDITLYRDDLSVMDYLPAVKKTEIPFSIDGKPILLVDDVIFSGRTVRAAMDAIIDFGRPSYIQLAVLIDRGCRELPIQPDIVGKKVVVPRNEIIDVHFKEQGYDDDSVIIRKRSKK